MAKNEIDLKGFEHKKDDDCYKPDSMYDEYSPIQQKSTIFKFLLYTTKVEIKANSLIKMIYHSSLYETGIWFVGFLIFLTNPSQLFYIWFLVLHVPRSYLGLLLLKYMPKTYEIIENLSKHQEFDEDKLVSILETQIRDSFIARWADNKLKFYFYLLSTIICTTIDLIMLIVMVVIFGNDRYILMEICLLFVTIPLLGNIII